MCSPNAGELMKYWITGDSPILSLFTWLVSRDYTTKDRQVPSGLINAGPAASAFQAGTSC
jgi:hypothetical protein